MKLGKLVAASELYLEATHLPRGASWQAVQDEAVTNAERERAELLPRIPRLKIGIEGAEPGQVAVSIDERKVPSIILDTEDVVDPGQRTVVGTLGQQKVREVVTLKEGEQRQVTLQFSAAPVVAGESNPVAPAKVDMP